MSDKIFPKMSLVLFLVVAAGCTEVREPVMRRPAEEYAIRLKAEYARRDPVYAAQLRRENAFQSAEMNSRGPTALQNTARQNSALQNAALQGEARARLNLVSDDLPPDEGRGPLGKTAETSGDLVTNLGTEGQTALGSGRSPAASVRDYSGPLNLGDPGVSASLWKESRGGNDLFRDYRAFQPMDLITILINEKVDGKKEGNTDVKQDSSFVAALKNFFGLENWGSLNLFNSASASSGAGAGKTDLANLVNANLTSEFKGTGQTERKGHLTGTISAMVAEVLPSGVLRIEGEKIVTINNEEENMIISGLVRPEDVTSNNEVDSGKIANVRIDYYGDGLVGDSQRGGWLGRVMRRWWPF